TSSVRIGWRVWRKGSTTRPRFSRVTTPSSASASPGCPRTTGVCPSPLGQREVALRHVAVDGGAIGEHELHLTLGDETGGLPHRLGEERVGRSAVDEEANARFPPGRTADRAVDVADTHALEYRIPVGERHHPKIAE